MQQNKQSDIQPGSINFDEKAKEFLLSSQNQFYFLLQELTSAISQINVQSLILPKQFVESTLVPLGKKLVDQLKQPQSKLRPIKQALQLLFAKIIEIYAKKLRKIETLDSIDTIIKSYHPQIIPAAPKGLSITTKNWRQQINLKQSFPYYDEFKQKIIKELGRYAKIVWELQLKQLINLVSYVNFIESKMLSNQCMELLEDYIAEIGAFFKSGREELINYSARDQIQELEKQLLRKIFNHIQVERLVWQLPLSLSLSLLTSNTYRNRQAGRKLIDKAAHDFRFTSHKSYQFFAQWINKYEIFEKIGNKTINEDIFEEQPIDSGEDIFSTFKKCKFKQEDRIKLLLQVYIQGDFKSKRVNKFIKNELDPFYLSIASKDIIYHHINKFDDFSKLKIEYIELIKELNIKDDQIQCVYYYKLLVRMMRNAYDKWSDVQRDKIKRVYEQISYKYITYIKRTNKLEGKLAKVEQIANEVMIEVTSVNIFMFHALFIRNQLGKVLGNNSLQNIITACVKNYNYLQSLFNFMKVNNIKRVQEKEIENILKFVTSKLATKENFIKKHHLSILSKYPEIYRNLLENGGHSQLQQIMKNIIEQMQIDPSLSFSIFKMTFLKVNYSSYNSAMPHMHVSVLDNSSKQSQLIISPQKLSFYEEMSNLLSETTDAGLRTNLCQFIVSLYINYSKHRNQNGQQELIKFIVEIIQTCIKDLQEYKIDQNNKNIILVDLQLINKCIQFTDLLGCGIYKPHKSLVQTSSIYLVILNNITFGDDVQKTIHHDFPSSMILFDALTIIGLSFKCGPEEIILKQGERLISSICNSMSLQDLHLTNNEIIAQKNMSNSMVIPQISINGKKQQLTPLLKSCITQIFHRFAYEGKMSLIQCTQYARQASGTQCLSNDQRVRQLLEVFDSDKDGIVVLEDFLRYYTKNMLKYSDHYRDTMLKSLYNLRYRKNLQLYSSPLDISHYYYVMARHRIIKYPNLYHLLFQFSSFQDKQLSSQVKQLLLFLPTCSNSQFQIQISIDFTDDSQFYIYYRLISILKELSLSEDNQNALQIKKQRIEAFLRAKNNQVIFELLGKYHAKPQKNQYQYKSFLICLKILRSLINIEYLSTINLSQFQLKNQLIQDLPQTNFFSIEAKIALQTRNTLNYETLLVLQLSQSQVCLEDIISCCFHSDLQIRKISCSFIYVWQLKNRFSSNMFVASIPESNNEEWFNLLCAILEKDTSLNYEQLKVAALNQLAKRQQSQTHKNDAKMNGYLKILERITTKSTQTSSFMENVLTNLLKNAISSQNRTLIYQIIKQFNINIGIDYFEEMLTKIRPSQECQMRNQFTGIKNLGAICYINSILQQFFMIEHFRQMILNKNIPQNCKVEKVHNKEIVDDFMYQLQRLYFNLQYGKKKYVIPSQFCYSYKDYFGLPINTSIQQDSHQFLNRLIEKSEDAFKIENKLSQFQKIFSIKKLTEIQCQKCKNKTNKIQNEYHLLIQVKNHNNLAQSLKKCTDSQFISDYFCQKCQMKVNRISKRSYINELPEMVILNLMRIIYDLQKGQKVKVHSRMSFPMEINFSEYMKNDNLDKINTRYELKGVVVHTGTSQAGHYYSLIRTDRGWMKFNDQNITPFDEKEIERECFGGYETKDDGWQDVTYSTNAYILFYERKQLKYEKSFEVQNQFSAEVMEQNNKLINQLQIHQESFFKAIISYYQSIKISELNEMINRDPFYKFKLDPHIKQLLMKLKSPVQKAMTFLNVFSDIKPEYKYRIGAILAEIYFLLPEQTTGFLQDVNLQTYIENILTHPDEHFREMLKSVLYKVLLINIRYFKIDISNKNQDSKLVVDILEQILSNFQSNLFYGNITKIDAYLNFWRACAKSSVQFVYFLISNDYLFKLLDLLMGKQSAYMKYHPNAQDVPLKQLPIIYESISILLYHKKNMKGKGLSQFAVFETTSLEAAIISGVDLYKRIQRLRYSIQIISILSNHYCVQDFDYSISMAEVIIRGINNQDDNFLNYLKLASSFLLMKDSLQPYRLCWILGIPQYRQVKPKLFCLDMSHKSIYIEYKLGLLSKGQSQKKSFLSLLFDAVEKMNYVSAKGAYLTKVFLELSISSQAIFNYLINIPPPTYLQRSIYSWIPNFLVKLNKQNGLILENKQELVATLNEWYNMLETQMVGLINDRLPIQKYIIGKTQSLQLICKLKNDEYQFELTRLCTYILDNLPQGDENKSMPKNLFDSHQVRGIANAFIDYRSKKNIDEVGLEKKHTIYTLEGQTKQSILLTFKGVLFNYSIILSPGIVRLNFPYKQEGGIGDHCDIVVLKENKIVPIPEEIYKVFKITEVPKQLKPDGEMEIQPNDANAANPANQMIDETEQKFKCVKCTFDNDISNERCQLCNHIF